jgi:hypothetical protein
MDIVIKELVIIKTKLHVEPSIYLQHPPIPQRIPYFQIHHFHVKTCIIITLFEFQLKHFRLDSTFKFCFQFFGIVPVAEIINFLLLFMSRLFI